MKVVGDCLTTADLGEERVPKDQSTMPEELRKREIRCMLVDLTLLLTCVPLHSYTIQGSTRRLKRKREDGVIWIGGS